MTVQNRANLGGGWADYYNILGRWQQVSKLNNKIHRVSVRGLFYWKETTAVRTGK